LGDHLYQDSSFFPENFRIQKLSYRYEKRYFIGDNTKSYNRFPLNIFINSLLPKDKVKNRTFSHFDMLPVLIESIGGYFDAEGLALGRSINASRGTLIERYGESYMNKELRRTSKRYNSFWGVQK
jgi:hypothetical protein